MQSVEGKVKKGMSSKTLTARITPVKGRGRKEELKETERKRRKAEGGAATHTGKT